MIYVNVTVDDWEPGRSGWGEQLVHFADRLLPERPAILCDGGRYAWGVVSDPATRQFEPPRFNGR